MIHTAAARVCNFDRTNSGPTCVHHLVIVDVRCALHKPIRLGFQRKRISCGDRGDSHPHYVVMDGTMYTVYGLQLHKPQQMIEQSQCQEPCIRATGVNPPVSSKDPILCVPILTGGSCFKDEEAPLLKERSRQTDYVQW